MTQVRGRCPRRAALPCAAVARRCAGHRRDVVRARVVRGRAADGDAAQPRRAAAGQRGGAGLAALAAHPAADRRGVGGVPGAQARPVPAAVRSKYAPAPRRRQKLCSWPGAGRLAGSTRRRRAGCPWCWRRGAARRAGSGPRRTAAKRASRQGDTRARSVRLTVCLVTRRARARCWRPCLSEVRPCLSEMRPRPRVCLA
jgi:hypothetical protein